MEIYVIAKNGYEKLYWGEQYLHGISAGARERGDELVLLDADHAGAAKGKAAILLSSSAMWLRSVIRANPDITPLLTTESPMPGVSGVSFQYGMGVRELLGSLRSEGYERTALVTCNPDSCNDLAKKREFQLLAPEDAIYYHHAISSRIFDELMCEKDRYDSFICTNDIILIMLRRQLTAAGDDLSRYGFATFGDRSFFREGKVLYAYTDYREQGRTAVDCYRQLAACIGEGRCLRTITVKLDCICGGHRAGETAAADEENTQTGTDYFEDSSAFRAQQLKFLLGGADELDVEMVRLAAEGHSYEEISERLYISVNSLKRRMKNMADAAGCAGKNELIDMLKPYF